MEELADDTIRQFLESAPIHVAQEYLRPRINRGDVFINQIDYPCLVCDQVRPFKSLHSRGAHGVQAVATGVIHYEFLCFGCSDSSIMFSVHHLFQDSSVLLTKYGEYPRKALSRDKSLQKFFRDDKEYYEKAVSCLANSYGIGAFSYFRRIIENNIFKLLELLAQDISISGDSPDLLEKIDQLKTTSPMSEKIELANREVPEYLIPSGVNPLGRIYKVLSEGIHSLSDEECLDRALGIEACIKYLVGELSTRKKNRDKFAGMVGKL